jgi:hypothetical protein
VIVVGYLAAAPVHDLLARRRVHPASLRGGLAPLASVPIRIAISHSAAWRQFALWLIR